MRLAPILIAVLTIGVLSACSSEDPIDDPDVGFQDTETDTETTADTGEPDAVTDVGFQDTEADTEDTGDQSDVDIGPHPDTGTDAEDDTDVEEEPLEYPLETCDSLDPEVCAFPWPSNLYLAPDETQSTGYQIRFDEESLPANSQNNHISPHVFEHLDGFDLGVPIMARFPDLDASDIPHEYQIEDSLDDDAQVLLFAVQGDELERIPYFAELDGSEEDTAKKTLFVRPALILENDTRYVVAFRNLIDLDGDPIEPSESFRALRDGDTDDDAILQHRQERFDEVFELLEDADVDRQSLTLAWDFVTASSDALHGPMRHIRDDAMDWADEHGIEWTIEEMTEFSPDPDDPELPFDAHIALDFDATIEVPQYLESYDAVPGAMALHRNDDGVISRNGTRLTNIRVRIPHQAIDGDDMGVILFGHGLFGTRDMIDEEKLGEVAEDFGYIMMGADLLGMSTDEVEFAAHGASDLTHFTVVTDLLHQGLLQYLLAARTAGDEFTTIDPITSRNISVDSDDVYYFGASQGGIFGHTFMALTPNVQRGYLGVPGNNFSTLLQRSQSFGYVNEAMSLWYPSVVDRNINVAAMSLMWSTVEAVSFARHIRHDPFDGDPRDVLLVIAKGDYQVATITNENTARSDIGIPLLENYDVDRQPFGAEVVSYPHQGSGTILFDFGNPWPPPGNLPPSDGLGDPHGRIVEVDDLELQIDSFFRDGQIIDICGGEPCHIDNL